MWPICPGRHCDPELDDSDDAFPSLQQDYWLLRGPQFLRRPRGEGAGEPRAREEGLPRRCSPGPCGGWKRVAAGGLIVMFPQLVFSRCAATNLLTHSSKTPAPKASLACNAWLESLPSSPLRSCAWFINVPIADMVSVPPKRHIPVPARPLKHYHRSAHAAKDSALAGLLSGRSIRRYTASCICYCTCNIILSYEVQFALEHNNFCCSVS